jgi:multiple sugar transport system ATP-binding protein
MASLALKGLRKVYNKSVVAVDDLTLEIPDGLIVSLLGPSGCGKTTTMRMIAGFEAADKGTITVNGADITLTPPNKRNMSMVFQFPVVYTNFTIYDNMATPLRNAGMSEDKIREIIRTTSPEFGIEESTWNDVASNLSISERQRLSLAHAFAVERNVYILDEPFSNVDPKSRVRLARYVRQIQQVKRHTIVFVTHSQSEALTLSDRIAVMKDGKILQYDTPETIYTRPVSTFVGWFLGNPGMNFVKCAARSSNGVQQLDGGGFLAAEKVPAAYQGRLPADGNVILGIRPEHIAVSRTSVGGDIQAKCLFAEPVGSRLLLNIELAKNVQVNVKAPTTVNVSKGDTVFVRFPDKHAILFDAKTEMAI